MSIGIRAAATLAVMILALGSGAQAKDKSAPAPVLSAAELDPLRLLPPPPAPGSPAEKADVAELHRIQDARTPAELAAAKDSGEHEDASGFASVLGPRFNLDALPATARLLAQVRADDAAATKRAKAIFKRPRPWIVDPTIVGCSHGDNKPLSSYPSGHSTMIFAAATVLAELMPEHGQDLMRYATGYAHDRLVCGHHFQTDVAAGEVWGTVIARDLLHRPELNPKIEAARAELKAAGF